MVRGVVRNEQSAWHQATNNRVVAVRPDLFLCIREAESDAGMACRVLPRAPWTSSTTSSTLASLEVSRARATFSGSTAKAVSVRCVSRQANASQSVE